MQGARVTIRLLKARDRDEFLAAVRRSRRLHHPFTHPPDTPEAFADYIRRSPRRRTFAFVRNDTGHLVGVAGLSEITRKLLQSAFLGYYAFRPHDRKGYMKEGLDLVVRYAFDDLKLHRVHANVQPTNPRSAELLRSLGFQPENASPRYLRIDGDWRDHVGWVLLADGAPEDEVLAVHGPVTLHRVTGANWRRVRALKVARDQHRFVGDVNLYLTLCAYGGTWRPLEVRNGEKTVGFMMWGRDADDMSYWLGGLVIDRTEQRKGNGRAALEAGIAYLRTMPGCRQVALSYHPENEVAQRLYASVGFIETGKISDGEVVARLDLPRRRRP
jgi:ribosomal-protein-alanine N-acetyltransferase